MQGRRGLTVLSWTLSAALLACQLIPSKTHHSLFNPRPYLEGGETLMHGLPPGPLLSVYMPLSCLSAAAVFNHHLLSPYWNDAAPRLARMLLVVALGSLLQPFAGLTPMLAVLLLTAAPPGHALFNFPESFYSLLILVTACLLAWRAQKPTVTRSLLLCLGIGTTLLFRSPLAFFAPLLVLYEMVFPGPAGRKTRWKQHLILCVVPYIFLLPWIQLNLAVHSQWIAFEHGPDTGNIIGAVAGLTDDGGKELTPSLIAPSLDISKAAGIYKWALSGVLHHPLRYAIGYAKRFAETLGFAPLLLLCCALSLAAYRDREDFRQVGLLVSYFILIHCAITIQDRYFEPLWPVAAVCAAALFARPQTGSALATDSLSYRLSVKAVLCALVMVFASSLVTEALVLRYANALLPAPRKMAAAFDAAISTYPNDAWLLSARGKRRLQRGELPGAIADFSTAAGLEPGNPDTELEWAWARTLQGSPAGLEKWEPSKDHAGDSVNLNADIFKAAGLVRSGRTAQADDELRSALAAAFASAVPEGYDAAALGPSGLEPIYSGFLKQALGPLWSRPAPERLAFIDELVKIMPRCGNCLRAQAQARYDVGDYGLAAESLDAARVLGAGTAGSQARDELLQAGLAITAGRQDEARQALLAARRAGGDDSEVLIAAARLYNRMRDYRSSLETLAALPSSARLNPAVWLERAEAQSKAGHAEAATRSLAEAASLTDDPLDLRKICFLYQEVRRYPEAIEILDRLIGQTPGDAGLLKDRGVCQFAAGRVEEAISSLRKALSLDPRQLEAALTLSAVYASRGRYAEAVKTCDSALAVPPPVDSRIRKLIAKDRRDFLSRLPH